MLFSFGSFVICLRSFQLIGVCSGTWHVFNALFYDRLLGEKINGITAVIQSTDQL